MVLDPESPYHRDGIEDLVNLRPRAVTELLEICRSVKVNAYSSSMPTSMHMHDAST